MVNIILKKELAPKVHCFRVEAPQIARKAQPGQFVILRLSETGERIPLTIADTDTREGSITLLVQEAGKTTVQMAQLKTGDRILDVVGPLGVPTHLGKFGTVIGIGGGFGIAALYPVIKALKNLGNNVLSIIGARTKQLLIMEEEMRNASNSLLIATDDGSYGEKGFVTDVLKKLIEKEKSINRVFAIGPVVMMRAVCEITRPYKIPTIVSLNPIMIDGTGMCGGCRVTIGGKTKFACVEGPDFDGHLVDFDELVKRQKVYIRQEKETLEKLKSGHPPEEEECRLKGNGSVIGGSRRL